MNKNNSAFFVSLCASLIGVLLFLSSHTVIANPQDGTWTGIFDYQPVDGAVYDFATDSKGNIIIVGDFPSAGGVAGTNRVARWNVSTEEFESIGGGFDGDSFLDPEHVVIDTNNNIYIAGFMLNVNDINEADGIIKWDETAQEWQALSTGLSNRSIDALAIDANDDVYLGGPSSLGDPVGLSGSIIRWDSSMSAYEEVGFGALSSVNTFLIHDGVLYAGGSFENGAGITQADEIAKMDISTDTWSAMGQGTQNTVNDIQLLNNNLIIIGGTFSEAIDNTGTGVADTSRIAAWNLTSEAWVSVDDGVITGNVTGIGVLGSDRFVIFGTFTDVDNVNNSAGLAYFDLSDGGWFAPAGGLNSQTVHSVVSFFRLSIDEFILGGLLAPVGQPMSALAQYDDGNWVNPFFGANLGDGLVNIDGFDEINEILMADNGDIYICGDFDNIGGVINTRNIAEWDGEEWSALGTGLGQYCEAIAMDSQGNLYAGGEFNGGGVGDPFDGAGGVADTEYIAMWDGAAWHALAEGLDSTVFSIGVDSQDNVYAMGEFGEDNLNSTLLDGIGMWNGANWVALGVGIGSVSESDIIIDEDDNVYVGGGESDMAGIDDADYVAMWNGVSWQALGMGFSAQVNALEIHPSTGELYAGGEFDEDGLRRLARWDGVSWHDVGGGVESDVKSLVFDKEGNLFVGGNFEDVSDPEIEASSIAVWNGATWFPLDVGVDNTELQGVKTLVTDGNGTLYVGGSFFGAGGFLSPSFSIWQYPAGGFCFPIVKSPTEINVVCL